jgi:hypothetical protein
MKHRIHSRGARPNNGIHPTASQRECHRGLVANHVGCAACDAGRYASECMRVRRNSLITALILAASFLGAGAARGQEFDPSGMSERGRAAYRGFLRAPVFMTGSPWGQPNPAYRQLHALLQEEGAVEAFRNLARHGAPGGRLYGFLGLRLIDIKAFREEAERYRAGQPETAGSLFGFYVVQPPREKVERQEGCLGWVGDVETELGKIEAGSYDEDYKRAVG